MQPYNNTIIEQDLKNIFEKAPWEAFEGKSVLVTGANGHIASYIVMALAYAVENGGKHIRIIVNSRNETRLRQMYAPLVGKDWFIIAASDIASLNLKETPDYIFHFAGNASPYFIANDPVGILSANIGGTFNVCEMARRNPECRVIYASSREVYGENTTDEVLTETSFGRLDPLEPRSCYPESKRAAECIIEAYHRQFGISFAVVRIAHCYGPGMKLENDGRVMSDFINDAVNKRDIRLNSTGEALRAFIYISDVVVALLIIAATRTSEAWNLSNETEEISVFELARTIAGITGGIEVSRQCKPVDGTVYTAYKRKPLDCSKLLALGWHPIVELTDGLARTINSITD